MSRLENADVPSPRGERPLSKAAVASATFAGLGLLGAAGYMALLIALYDDNEPYNPWHQYPWLNYSFFVGALCLGASLAGLVLGSDVVNSREIRSGAERGRPLATVAIVLGLIAILLSCCLMSTNLL